MPWPYVSLEAIAQVGAGNSAPQDPRLFVDGTVPFIRTSDVGRVRFGSLDDAEDWLNAAGATGLRRWPVGTILFPKSGASTFLNHRVITEIEACVASHLATIVPNLERVDPRFLLYFLRTADAKELTQDQGYPSLRLPEIGAIRVPLPPLQEQQRIAAILDEAFAGIAKATANAERNIENAEDLVEAQREGLISAAVPEAEKVTLQELLERAWIVGHLDGNHGADYPRKEEFVGSGVAYISANALSGDAVDFGRAKFLTTDRAARIRKGVARHGDVLFAHNATVGPVAVLSTDLDRVILGTSLTYYRCDQQHILPAYLAHFMRSARFRQQYEAVMRQSTRNQVPITKQREFFHLIPPLAVQESIAGTLDEYEMQAAALRAVYRQKLAALSELRASLLHRAFSGQLTDASAITA